MRLLTLAVLCTTAFPLCAGIIASSTFDTPADGADGWTITGNGSGPAYVAAGGNPGGYITTTDDATAIAYFVAPSKFHGDQSAALGGTLTFDLRQSITIGQYVDQNPLLWIIGNGVVLSLPDGVHPASTFTSYTVSLTPSAGWRSAGAPASLAQMQSAFANITHLSIRAEYSFFAGDIDDLDNVVLNSAIPEPSTALLSLAGCGLLLLRRRRR